MTLVVDASVAAKWIMQESNSDRALALRSEGPLIAPSLIGTEIGNALWKAVIRGEFRKADASAGLKSALGLLDNIVPNEKLNIRALEIAMTLKHAIYDCFYLALAENEDATLVSADRRLLDGAKRLGKISVRAL